MLTAQVSLRVAQHVTGLTVYRAHTHCPQPLLGAHPRATSALVTAPKVDSPRRLTEKETGPRAVAQGSLEQLLLMSDPGWGRECGLILLQLSLLPMTF